MRPITVRLRYGKKLHAISEGSESARTTFCGRVADGGVVDADVPNCLRCLREIALRASTN